MKTFKNFLENVEAEQDGTEARILYIMRGVPGSGKSTRAKQMAGDGVIYATDEYWGKSDEEYLANTQKALKDGTFNKIMYRFHIMNQERTVAAMEKGISPIVVDNTNVKKEHMRPYVYAAKEHGYQVEFIEPDSPWWKKIKSKLWNKELYADELKKAAKDLSGRNVHGVPADTIHTMLQQWHSHPNIEDF